MQNDFTYIAIILGLFVMMFGLVWACDKIIGSDQSVLDEQDGTGPDTEVDVEDEAVAA